MDLDERKQMILGAVVRDYVEMARPIGSTDLASRYSWGVKSATIRNALAGLSDLGLLRQPHTSAGRIPSDRGYRFYVDHLMVSSIVSPNHEHDDRAMDLERLLRQTCALLTRMTCYTSVATPPRPAGTKLNRLFVSPAGEGRLLIVALFSTGHAENRLLSPIPDTLEPNSSEIVALNNALTMCFAGRTLDSLSAADPDTAPKEFGVIQAMRFDTLANAVRRMAGQAAQEDRVVLEGAGEMLRQPEFRDVAKIELILESLQNRSLLYQSLSEALWQSEVSVIIGEENPVAAMRECSVVTASYYVGARERGTIGVVGPTRMDYDRAVPAVSFCAQSLSRTLGQVCGE